MTVEIRGRLELIMVNGPEGTGWSREGSSLAEQASNEEVVAPESGAGQPPHGTWYRRFFDSCRHMMYISGEDGRLLDVNPAGVALFGYATKEEMLRIPSVAVLYRDPGDREWFQRALEEQGYVKDYEVEMLRKDGSVIIASVTTNIWRDERGAILYEGTLRDITERRRWLNVMKKINERNQMLNEHILHMLMLVSHDIRGPLVAMAATLKLLIRGSFGHMDESVTNVLKDLMVRVVRLLGTAEDCLGKASSVDGTLEVDRQILDLRQDIIDPILDELSGDIESQEIRIDNRLGAIPAGMILIKADKVWLKTIFRNLFKNAIKYGGSRCTIAFGFEDHGSYYRLNVYNSGRPIPEEHRERLFTKFGRIKEGESESKDGVGLGLYLIREIIQKHGGDIWYEAKPDGSDFVFTIAKEGVGPA
jgi:PAS domain S-box-containing protein